MRTFAARFGRNGKFIERIGRNKYKQVPILTRLKSKKEQSVNFLKEGIKVTGVKLDS